MNRWMQRLLGISLFLALFLVLGATRALAVALGNIEVTSHLGEPFHAEVPLHLAKGERITSVFVEPASPSEYRILEVYRDPALNVIRTDIKNDARGARVELSSDSPIEAPFFNLVLKVRHGHATHFKKFPIFLDLPQARPAAVKPLPTVSAAQPREQATEAGVAAGGAAAAAAAQPKETEAPAFKPYDGWARIGRYGPMVYGDTISTVARRLRIDDRYTMAQVMMALFYKNRSKFDHDNVNLIKAGTYLDVPKAREVEAISPAKARQLLAEHNRVWAQLKKQPRYAAVAEAQKNRYKARVRVGKAATGVAAAPATEASPATAPAGKGGESKVATPARPVEATNKPAAQGGAAQETAGETGPAAARVKELERQNAELQQKLKDAETRMEALSAKLASPDVAAANARIKKLELRLARLQAELDRQKQAHETGGAAGWMVYGLGGLVVVLLAVVGWLLSRMRRMSAPAMADVAQAAGGAAAMEAPEAGADFEEAVQEFEEVGEGELEAAAAGGEATESTRQMSADEYKDAFTDSVPDLTESDTAEMEPFQEAVEEEPDPNVDYLAEADVYLRYGMEEEALRQLRLAIKQRPDNAEAHARLVQTLKASGDEAAAEEAASQARETLAGDALKAFEDALAAGAGGAAEAEGGEDVDLGDTLPPTGIEALDFGETGEGAAEAGAEPAEAEETLVLGEGGEETETLADLDLELGAAETAGEPASEEPTLTEEVELPDEATIGHEEPEGVTEEETPASESEEVAGAEEAKPEADAEGVLGMTEVDMGELDWDAATTLEETAQETVVESPVAGAEEAETETGEPADQAAPEPEQEVPAAETATSLDLDLSDIEMPEIEAADERDDVSSIEIETSDLEKTVAIDWSGDTEALEEMTGGLGSEEAGEPEAETPAAEGGEQTGAAEEEAGQEPEQAKEEVATSSGILDIGLDEIDMESAEASGADVEMDDFTSTVQLTVETRAEDESEDIGLESVELEAPVDMSLKIEEVDLPDEAADEDSKDGSTPTTVEQSPEISTVELKGEDNDIVRELDTLLTELNLEEETPSPESLDADRAKSLLSEAESAIENGDVARARELLGEAEGAVDDANREWFESLKRKADES